eukprot:363208-Chlamydomonas_euryale.AAC.1
MTSPSAVPSSRRSLASEPSDGTQHCEVMVAGSRLPSATLSSFRLPSAACGTDERVPGGPGVEGWSWGRAAAYMCAVNKGGGGDALNQGHQPLKKGKAAATGCCCGGGKRVSVKGDIAALCRVLWPPQTLQHDRAMRFGHRMPGWAAPGGSSLRCDRPNQCM